MKKTLFITLGILLVLSVVGVWVYLMTFGKPESADEVFANFGIGGSDSNQVAPETPSIVDTSPVTNSGGPQQLKQLTTRPVAGAVFVDGGIRYVEHGTGHIYEIALSSGSETLISGTTIPKVIDAVFSPSGNGIAFTVENGTSRDISVGTISRNNEGEGTLTTAALPKNSKDPAFSPTGEELYFLEITARGAEGRSYNIAKKTTRSLFSLPLREVEALWGTPTYVYTTPSSQATGYIYKISKGNVEYVMDGKPGLLGVPAAGSVIVTYLADSRLQSHLVLDNGTMPEPITMLEQKCVTAPNDFQYVYCAAPSAPLGVGEPDNWFKGVSSFSDMLWRVDAGLQDSELLSNFVAESGREIDVRRMGIDAPQSRLYFINKNDNTLWTYDLSQTPQPPADTNPTPATTP